MAYRVLLLSTAEDDIDAMLEYYAKFYSGTAHSRYDELMSKFRKLTDNPYIYEEYDKNPRYRRLISGDYIGLYTLDDENKIVKVFRVLPGKLDLAKLLNLP